MPVEDNPLQALSDDALWNSQLLVNLICARSKTVFKEKHRTVLCNLLGPLTTEANNRGKSSPEKPFSASQQRIA
jgi:hypothetical protein